MQSEQHDRGKGHGLVDQRPQNLTPEEIVPASKSRIFLTASSTETKAVPPSSPAAGLPLPPCRKRWGR